VFCSSLAPSPPGLRIHFRPEKIGIKFVLKPAFSNHRYSRKHQLPAPPFTLPATEEKYAHADALAKTYDTMSYTPTLSAKSSPLPPPPPAAATSTETGLLAHLRQPLLLTHAYPPLLLCCFISGLADAAAFNAWGTFISMQTGNTIFLALGASGQPTSPPFTWLKGLVAISFFLVGCVLFSRGMRALGHEGGSRMSLVVGFAVQAVCFFAAAGLVQGGVVPVAAGTVTPAEKDPLDPRFVELLPLGILAFQAGGQIVSSRMLGFSEIPTNVLTSCYCDLVIDKALLKAANGKRDRRVASVLCLLLGGIVGGWLSRSGGGMGSVLWLGGSLKAGIVVTWLLWPKKEEDRLI
jgi:hypothetical protein